MSFITGITDVSCRFSLSRKKDGPLQKKSKIDSRGNHGYSNQFPDIHPFFLAQGPTFKEGFVSEPFENVNVYSLMCYLLGIKPAPNNSSIITSSAASAKRTQARLYSVDSSQCNFCFSSFVNEL